METILTLKALTAWYGDHKALDNITLSLPQNQITAVIGPSGCGKSTLLSCINGSILDLKESRLEGEITLNDRNILQIPPEELRRRVGLVLQTPAPFPFSIYKNMTYAPVYHGIRDRKKLDQIVTENLTKAGLYEEVKDVLHKSALKLSGGQQQRLCIARELTAFPEVLMLAEPCSALDIHSTRVIEELLLQLKESYTILLVTHNLAQAKRVADHVCFLKEGRLIEMGEKEELFLHPKQKETRDFLNGEL